MMKNWDTNTVISWGLCFMGVLSVAGWIAISILTGTNNGTEIPLSIASGLVGVLTGKKITERKYADWTPPPEYHPSDLEPKCKKGDGQNGTGEYQRN